MPREEEKMATVTNGNVDKATDLDAVTNGNMVKEILPELIRPDLPSKCSWHKLGVEQPSPHTVIQR